MTRRQVVAPALLLVLFAILVPARLPAPASGPSSDDCFLLADRPPDGRAPFGVLQRCSAMFPADVDLLANLAAAYEAMGRPADAEAAYRKVLDRDPDFAESRLRLGRLYLRRGAAAQAAEEADRALRVQPNRRALLDLRAAAQTALRGAPR